VCQGSWYCFGGFVELIAFVCPQHLVQLHLGRDFYFLLLVCGHLSEYGRICLVLGGLCGVF